MPEFAIALNRESRKLLRTLMTKRQIDVSEAADLALHSGIQEAERVRGTTGEVRRNSSLSAKAARLETEEARVLGEVIALDVSYATKRLEAYEMFREVTRLLLRYFGLRAEASYLSNRDEVEVGAIGAVLISPVELRRMSDRYLFHRERRDRKEP